MEKKNAFRLKAVPRLTEESILPEPMTTTAHYAWKDRFGGWKARWNIGRMAYSVAPGLYRLGSPDEESPVLVTANYKMTFDSVRRELGGRSLWLLVLDTKGINVWCAAGKGTFGTAEIIRRVKATSLERRISHRTLLLPQLGAPGVSADEVQRKTGFRVTYGPVRASDLPAFLDAGMVATDEMRRVRFTTWDRLVLVPVELVQLFKPALLLFGFLFLLNQTGLWRFGLFEVLAFASAAFTGAFLVPVCLPWIPGRAFSGKGALTGALASLLLLAASGFNPGTADLFASGVPAGSFPLAGAGPAMPTLPGCVPASGMLSVPGWLAAVGVFLLMTAFSSFTAMNFTGCSTYTSPTGVRREMKTAVPLQALATLLGALLLIAGRLVI